MTTQRRLSTTPPSMSTAMTSSMRWTSCSWREMSNFSSPPGLWTRSFRRNARVRRVIDEEYRKHPARCASLVGGLELKLRHQMRMPTIDQQLKLRAVRHELLECGEQTEGHSHHHPRCERCARSWSCCDSEHPRCPTIAS